MMTALAVIGVLIVAVLIWGFLADRRSRRRGHQLRSSGEIQASIRKARSDLRARNRLKRMKW